MNYILKQDFNWFGKNIPEGTIYVQHGADYWWPVINGAHAPTMQVDFMTVRRNTEYFEPVPVRVIKFVEQPTIRWNGSYTFWYEIAFDHPLTESEIRSLLNRDLIL